MDKKTERLAEATRKWEGALIGGARAGANGDEDVGGDVDGQPCTAKGDDTGGVSWTGCWVLVAVV
jgi:hypothetical protein